ncbi:iron ABC transporter permease [Paenibacillus sp. FSL H8-0548]|uniref:FecCD family ABC transporter permease n=1 Tax=Paenibacillus sp. FSL H8-0548 TaxID=1920422 RepID=UPI0021165770|nr:iron ABC transporter permease [Paenibacillus sp. FSL H8-0548]
MKIRLLGLLIGCMVVAACFAVSISIGKTTIPLRIVIEAFISFDGSREHLIIRSVRLPRAMIAVLVGCSLSVAGSVMQAISRNMLAGPEILASNNGAAMLLVIWLFLFGYTSSITQLWVALIGAGAASMIVFLLGSLGRGGLSSVKLILAGATINLLLSALVQGVLIFSEQSLDEMRFWLAGSLTGGSLEMLSHVWPYMGLGLAGAIVFSRQINLLSLGEEIAQGLGLRTSWIKLGALAIIMCLSGASVALAGPIGFIGLAIPHLARFLVGMDYRWIIPYSALLGAAILLLADIGARFIYPPQELAAGVVTALLGAPFLIYLAQRRKI